MQPVTSKTLGTVCRNTLGITANCMCPAENGHRRANAAYISTASVGVRAKGRQAKPRERSAQASGLRRLEARPRDPVQCR